MLARTLVLGLLLAGCRLSGTPGQGNNATFFFTNCVVDCRIDKHSVAAGGAHTQIVVDTTGGRTWSDARSSKPSVATFTRNGDRVDVLSGEAGMAELRIVDDRDNEVDRIEVRVDDTARLDFERSWAGPAALILPGLDGTFEVTTLRSDGDTLIGSGAVVFSLSGALEPRGTATDADRVHFHTNGPGAAQLAASCPGTSLLLPVEVVDPSVVATIQFARGDYARRADGHFDVPVEYVARTASGEAVFGAQCAWTTTGTVFGISPGSPTQLGDGDAKNRDEFTVAAQNGAMATCTIGSATASLPL